MSEYMSSSMFDSKDMIFNNQSGGGIQSCGLSIKSIMLNKGISPIMSINTDKDPENVERVSELFENLVIPLGLINGIKHINSGYNSSYNSGCNNEDDNKNIYHDHDDDEIDTFYNELLKLVEPNEKEIKNNELLFSGGKHKNKSKKNRESKPQSKINGVAKSKKNMKNKISN